ncbi:type II toxin-antitoxin system VapC family toxin [Halorussus salinus]|uniref:type II toxin-antitoxin system VapC family toxin n=1 Tax=Halorussus salinus TaxID=1364935 RepID=UPI001091BA0F|nr:type II toxin-antitoxin system VapC family toxin [Halorussus salinus]
MSDGPYLFDVGVTALAHAGTPVSETPLSYVREAIAGEIDAVVPYPSLVGAHHVLTSVYGFSNEDASSLMQRFMDANRVHWYDEMREETVREGFQWAGDANIEGWDGYYARVAIEEGVETMLTLDDDFRRIEGISTEVVLTTDEFERLNRYLDHRT